MNRIASIQTLADFWALVIDVWRHGLMGIAVGQIVAALFILALGALVRRVFSTAILRYLRFRLRQSSNAIDEAMLEALAPPLRFIPFVLAVFVASEFITENLRAKAIFAEVNRSLVAFVIFWGLFAIIEPLLLIFDGRIAVFSRAMIGWAVRVGKILVAALGAATILQIWGIQVGPILAGLGLFGVAVALGAQDLFKNLIAGIFIITERRFQNGDWILADGVVEGTVETIGLRTTKVRRFDMAPVYVPNSKLADNPVTNFAQMSYRRISWIIGLEYRTSVHQLRQIRDGIESYVLGNSEFAHPPEVPTFVRVSAFNDSSIDLMVYCFTRTTEWGAWLRIKEGLTYFIKELVEGAGSGFAFPSRSLYVEAMPSGTELFPLHQKPAAAHIPAASLVNKAP